ncbi:MAG: UvrD-helicase domain-containing protein [candidate division Zixibacteria bacterium]|jgi:DNA helicase-2/ATP-dependent DNA helicase PcrA|nr:UvrD-helicase domain-containing protein [candidate division Zixibacteria bacterium]
MTSDWLLKDLNPAQREAVETTDGPLLVIAGAGSGKTRVLTRRLAYLLVSRKATPYQLLAVTFTNKAAGEMKERVAELVGGSVVDMNVSTFHSFCARLLRREAAAIGYDTNFTIFDADDALSLVKSCLKDLGFSDGQFPPKGQMRKISDAKNRLIGPDTFAQQSSGYFESRTAEIYKLYQARLRSCNGMDFDDLLFNAVVLLRNGAGLGEKYRRFFRYILVDEYQDTNHVQYLLLKELVGAEKNICVVGDEDQSIYGWRGADISNILNFEKDFPGAKTIKLEQNYRSTSRILRAASSVIANNDMRKGKTLWTDVGEGENLELYLVDNADEEATRIVEQIDNKQHDVLLKDTVILYRTNAQSRPFEEQLRRRGLPYQIVGGVGFYQRKEIKDLLAYLKLIVNIKDDISFARVINYPKRGIGDKTLQAIAILAARESVPQYEIALGADRRPELSGKAKRIAPFTTLIEKFRTDLDHRPVDLLIQDLVTDLNLIGELLAEDPVAGQGRVDNIEAFIEGASEYARHNGENTLANYLAEISLFTDIDAYREIENKLTLMTLHAAKGLEFDTVYLVGLEEGLFPLQRTVMEPMELEEERRLFYVGATRAKKKLCLSSATTRFRFGEVESIPSRFIKEIPTELMDVRDYRSRHVYAQTGSAATVPSFLPKRSARSSAEPGELQYEYEDEHGFKAGRIVMHPTFGRGRIMKVDGYGESVRLEIMFSGIGMKKIMAKYARLKVIG